MNKMITSLNAVVAGFGSAFALFPTGHIDQYIKRESVESRMHTNFLRAGMRLDDAMSRVKDELKQQKRS